MVLKHFLTKKMSRKRDQCEYSIVRTARSTSARLTRPSIDMYNVSAAVNVPLPISTFLGLFISNLRRTRHNVSPFLMIPVHYLYRWGQASGPEPGALYF